MVRRPGSTGRYAPESGPILLRASFVAHDPLPTSSTSGADSPGPSDEAANSDGLGFANIHRLLRNALDDVTAEFRHLAWSAPRRRGASARLSV
jgi:hypothetical protein